MAGTALTKPAKVGATRRPRRHYAAARRAAPRRRMGSVGRSTSFALVPFGLGFVGAYTGLELVEMLPGLDKLFDKWRKKRRDPAGLLTIVLLIGAVYAYYKRLPTWNVLAGASLGAMLKMSSDMKGVGGGGDGLGAIGSAITRETLMGVLQDALAEATPDERQLFSRLLNPPVVRGLTALADNPPADLASWTATIDAEFA